MNTKRDWKLSPVLARTNFTTDQIVSSWGVLTLHLLLEVRNSYNISEPTCFRAASSLTRVHRSLHNICVLFIYDVGSLAWITSLLYFETIYICPVTSDSPIVCLSPTYREVVCLRNLCKTGENLKRVCSWRERTQFFAQLTNVQYRKPFRLYPLQIINNIKIYIIYERISKINLNLLLWAMN